MEETKLTKELGIAIAVVWKQWSCPFSDEPGVKGGPRAAANVREGGGGKGREGGRVCGCRRCLGCRAQRNGGRDGEGRPVNAQAAGTLTKRCTRRLRGPASLTG